MNQYCFPEIEEKMTPEKAIRIRELRVDKEYTWRALASQSFDDWGEDACWEPHSNQLAGMDLCRAAAEMFKEDAGEDPWN